MFMVEWPSAICNAHGLPWFLRNWMAKVWRNRCAGAVPEALNQAIETIN